MGPLLNPNTGRFSALSPHSSFASLCLLSGIVLSTISQVFVPNYVFYNKASLLTMYRVGSRVQTEVTSPPCHQWSKGVLWGKTTVSPCLSLNPNPTTKYDSSILHAILSLAFSLSTPVTCLISNEFTPTVDEVFGACRHIFPSRPKVLRSHWKFLSILPQSMFALNASLRQLLTL